MEYAYDFTPIIPLSSYINWSKDGLFYYTGSIFFYYLIGFMICCEIYYFFGWIGPLKYESFIKSFYQSFIFNFCYFLIFSGYFGFSFNCMFFTGFYNSHNNESIFYYFLRFISTVSGILTFYLVWGFWNYAKISLSMFIFLSILENLEGFIILKFCSLLSFFKVSDIKSRGYSFFILVKDLMLLPLLTFL